MKQSGMYEYSLWLMPKGKSARRASAAIRTLAKENGTLVFKPHITLLGWICGDKRVITEKARNLASGLGGIPISFDGISHSKTYTKTLFVKVKANRAISRAHRLAEKTFGHKKSKFIPHLSLMYANLSKAARLRLINDINNADFAQGFTADNLSLYARRWEGKEWRKVDSFKIR